MIESRLIHCNPERVRLKIVGHAGAAPAGEDLICAGVSALWLCLVATAKEHGWVGEIRESEGYAEMEIKVNRRNRAEVFQCLGVITAGLKVFAKLEPEFVQFVEDRGEPVKTG